MLRRVLYDCNRATLLILKKEEGRISIPERLRLYYHLLHCSVCRNFGTQSAWINTMVKNLARKSETISRHSLDPAAKQRISAKIKETIEKKD